MLSLKNQLRRCLHFAVILRHSSSVATSVEELSEKLQQAVTSKVAQQLSQQGYAVVDNVFNSATADALRNEVLTLQRRQGMHLNCTHLVDAGHGTTRLEKAGIFEAELTLSPSVQATAPLCAALDADRTLATLLSLFIPRLTLDFQATKLQVNLGSGACFPLHCDSDEAVDGRRVTAIFYLNPGWSPEAGGQLRLYPFPTSRPVDIAPLHNRLVLFSSRHMLHRVLPARGGERCCFTIWLSQGRGRGKHPGAPGGGTPTQRGAAEGPHADAAALRFLMQPSVRKHMLKLVYADEWEASLLESHPDSSARAALILQHRAQVELISKTLTPHVPLIQRLTKHHSDDRALLSSASLDWL